MLAKKRQEKAKKTKKRDQEKTKKRAKKIKRKGVGSRFNLFVLSKGLKSLSVPRLFPFPGDGGSCDSRACASAQEPSCWHPFSTPSPASPTSCTGSAGSL